MTPFPLSGFYIDFFNGAYILNIRKNANGTFIWTLNNESTQLGNVSEVMEYFNMIKSLLIYDSQDSTNVSIKLPTLPRIVISDDSFHPFINANKSLLEKILTKWYYLEPTAEPDKDNRSETSSTTHTSMPSLTPINLHMTEVEEEIITPHDPLYHYPLDSEIYPKVPSDIFNH